MVSYHSRGDLHKNPLSEQKPEAAVLLKNFWTIVGAMVSGAKRARTLLTEAAAVKMFSERGVIMARINFDLGLLSAIKKKRDADKLLQKIDAALAELRGGA
jgi:hypothetical protein